jgi:hypothetical protein
LGGGGRRFSFVGLRRNNSVRIRFVKTTKGEIFIMKLISNDAKQFPTLVKYLRTGFPDILKKEVIVKGLESVGIDYRDAVIYTTYGYDPLIDVRTIPSGDVMGWKVLDKWEGAPRIYGMQISTKIVKAFNKGDDLTTFSVAGTIRKIDATLLFMLVAWRKLAEAMGAVTMEEIEEAVLGFQERAIGEQRAFVNPFL